jgi:hypothetical protein
MINKFTDKGSKYSSFWMNDFDTKSIFDVDVEIKKGKDIIALSAHRRAIANFVRICTAKDIPVRFTSGKESYTDGKKVVLSGSLNDKNFDSAVGLALHEASHIMKTDFDSLRQFLADLRSDAYDYDNEDILNIKSISNYIEDRRIDYYMYKSAPGYMGYYDAMYERYFHSKHIDKALKTNQWPEVTYENYMNHMINFTNANRTLDVLPGLREVYNMIDMKNISRLNNTDEVLELAKKVHDFIVSQVPTQDIPSDTDSEGAPGEDGEDGESQEGSGPGQGTDDGTEVDTGDAQMTPGDDAEAGNTTGDGSDLSDRQKKMIENALKKQKDFINNGPRKTKLSKKDAGAINSLDTANAKIHEAGKDFNGGGWRKSGITKVIEMDLTQKALDEGLIPNGSSYKGGYGYGRKEEVVNKGLRLGVMLGRKLKIRNEETSVKNTRRDTGRIDRRLVAELGFGNERVFSNTFKTTFADGFIHISIDASGSMSGDNLDQSITSAVAVAKACSMIEGIDVKITFRTTTNDWKYGAHLPFILNAYDSRNDSITKIKTLFPSIGSSGTTPEGLCFEAVMKSIIKDADGKDAYFINYSDGMPMFNNDLIEYYNEGACKHTQSQVNTMKKNGIKVLSYFIGRDDSRTLDAFKMMYGTDSQCIDVENITAVARTINKKMLGQ